MRLWSRGCRVEGREMCRRRERGQVGVSTT